MLIRLVHQQGDVKGPLLITDIDSGLPNEEHGLSRKQPVYVPVHRTYFGSDNMVKIDRTKAGYIDLAPSDKVRLSADRGVIKGLEDNGFLSVTEIPTGALDKPTITAATFDTTAGADDGVGTADDGSIVITGTNFTSYDPSTTAIIVGNTGANTPVPLSEDTAGVTVTDTEITITGAANPYGSASGDIETVIVVANDKASDTFFPVTEV
jgi:hypothetical protein